ncbi:hypothetical protein CYLTODRAFT_26566 [Cylindrobasidium torrendii FP15055 ss-10]|uniref:Uncharacterized protein n=1 Tax=Cylindrobasidium torrendii FP15055 ss-10 TaxID=1314674 RepID=A0A0D7B8R7_9AGAR|nr:hypothetical protein CYLTODRAFT_26566 [Cylindrobasidium torrendii FP15055 ss-10]
MHLWMHTTPLDQTWSVSFAPLSSTPCNARTRSRPCAEARAAKRPQGSWRRPRESRRGCLWFTTMVVGSLLIGDNIPIFASQRAKWRVLGRQNSAQDKRS